MKSVVVSFFLAASALMPLTAAAATSDPYLFDQLKKPVYLQTFTALFKNEGSLEPWLKAYIKNRNGVDVPREFRLIGKQVYELYQVCQPHSCTRNVFFVFFTPDGANAWALFTKDDGTSRYFGNPEDKIKEALRAIEKESP